MEKPKLDSDRAGLHCEFELPSNLHEFFNKFKPFLRYLDKNPEIPNNEKSLSLNEEIKIDLNNSKETKTVGNTMFNPSSK